MRQQYDILLHLLTRHTNLVLPFSDYVKSDKFPDQISELLNTVVTIKYRNYYLADYSIIEKSATIIRNGEKVSSRPSDDTQQLEDRELMGPEKEESPFISEDLFRIVRADKTEPYRLIAISEDYSKIIINSSKIDSDNKYEFEYLVSEYPIQMNEYIGLGCYDQYAGEIPELKAATLRVDASEPCYSVLVEFLGNTGVIRFILGDEVMSKLYDYYDYDGSRDYDNKDAKDYDNPVDINGVYADHSSISKFDDINGGTSNNWDKLYTSEEAMRDDEITEFRKNVLEGKVIYGTV